MQQQADTVIPLMLCSGVVGPAAADSAADLEDPSKAETWQKLTHLQQHMQGLIAAVESQLTLTHRTDRAHSTAETAANSKTPLNGDHVSSPQLGLVSLSHGLTQAPEACLGQDSDSAELPGHSEADLAIGTHADSQAADKMPEGCTEPAQATAGKVAHAAVLEGAADAEANGAQQPCSADTRCLEVQPHEQVSIDDVVFNM